MNKYNTLFGQLLSLIKRPEFNRLCKKHDADKYCKSFSAWNEFSVLIFAQISGQNGLCINDFPWAKFRSTKSGVKIHVKSDVGESVPEYLFITNADKHENSTQGSMRLKEGDVVTFDRGYNNYRSLRSSASIVPISLHA